MSSIKICKCGSLASWNSYFGGYYCHNCGLILEDGLPDGGRGGHLMDIEKLIERLRTESLYADKASLEIMDLCMDAATALSTLQTKNAQLRESRDHWKRLAHELSEGVNGKDAEHERLQAENEKLREQVRQLETQARTERCDAADYDCRELGALRREVSSLRERLAADEWIDPAVELPPDDDLVLSIVSGKPADNITLEDAYELASYGSEGWIVEQFELWETPTVTWWRPLPDPPEKKKEER